MTLEFGDTVRIRRSQVTDQLGLSERIGVVFGATTPSSSGITNIVGDKSNDFAISVYFDVLDQQHWFDEDLLELVAHSAGTELELLELAKKYTKRDTEDWREADV